MFRSLTTRVWRLGLIVGVVGCAGCGMTLTPPGFVNEHRFSVCRGWFDFNSHRRPSFTFERYDHLPPNSAHVKMFRWRHGGSVEKVPQIEILKDNPYAYSDAGMYPSPGNCLDAPPLPEANINAPEPTNDVPKLVLPPPAPPSEIQEPSFPELNAPRPEMDETIASLRPEAKNDPVHVVLSFSEIAEAPQEPARLVTDSPFIPPPPAPPIDE